MRIVHLASGAGGMYCGSCLHSNTLAAAMRAAGEDVLLAPLYTPLRTDEENVSSDHLALGGINVYLRQRSALFTHLPRFAARLLDRPRLLRWVARRSSATRPERLGALTVSLLQGEEGRQRKEVDELVRWLEEKIQPDVVHLSNALLVGVARKIRRQLGVPVVCTLSGEDVFLEKIPEPHYTQARTLLRQRAADLAAMVAMNGYYADFMAEYLAVPRERIRVIPAGLNLAGHGARPAGETRPESLAVGFLARICPDKGLHQLLEAWKLLADDRALPLVHLRVAGYLDPADRPYLKALTRQVARWGLADRFEYVGELDRPGKIAFLQSLHVLSLPTVYRESKGLPVLEAWANAVPVVLPDHGAFPEMIADTGGGLLCEPGNAAELAKAIKRLLDDRQLAEQCGRRAYRAVHERYTAEVMAQRTAQFYREVVGE